MPRSEEDLRALIEQTHLLQTLTEHPGWPVLVDWLNELMRPRKVALLNGRAEDHATYLKASHFCIGATAAIDAPATVADMLEKEREARKA